MWKNSKFGLLLAVVMAGSMWIYVRHVLIPYQKAEALLNARPRGNLSDLYPRWLGTRELLLNHRDPYGPEVTREIQTGYYGRPIDPNRSGDPRDEQRFAYPVYVAFLLAPTIKLPFAEVRAAFVWILTIATAAGVWLWLRALRWRPPCLVVASLVILTLGSFAAQQGIRLQQLSLLVAALLAAVAALLAGGQLFLAGCLLALATIKPQLVLLPAAWLIVWTFANWRERRNFLKGFLLSGVALAGAGLFLLPGWLREFVAGLAAYNRYTGGRSLLDELTTPKLGAALSALCLLAMAIVIWRARATPASSVNFNLAFAFVLVVTVVVAPMIAPYNHLLLLPAVFLIVQSWPGFWRRGWVPRVLCSAAALVFFWSWLASIGLMLGSAFWPPAAVQRAWAVPLWSSLGVPLAVFGLLVLCIWDTAKQQAAASPQT